MRNAIVRTKHTQESINQKSRLIKCQCRRTTSYKLNIIDRRINLILKGIESDREEELARTENSARIQAITARILELEAAMGGEN